MEEQTPVEAPSVEETATQPVEILTSEGKFNESWRESLPEELGNHSIWSKYDNPVDLVKGAINAQSLAGRKAEEFWTSEDANDVAKRNELMGIGSSVDDYEIAYEAPEGIEVDENRINDFKQFAYENGLSKEAAQALVNWELEKVGQSIGDDDRAYEQSLQEAESELRSEWKGDQYEYNLAKVANSLDYLDMGDFKEDPIIANNPEFVKAWFEKVVPLLDNDKIIEQRNLDNAHTIEDQLIELESKMYSHENTNDLTYQQLTKQYGDLLSKKAKLQSSNY
tara:strand:+ start:2098 stop:2937 length:840 start_codon:yes stop_codon:yes gene_type:complete